MHLKRQKVLALDCDGVLNACDQETLAIIKPSLTLQDFENNRDWDVFKLLNKDELSKLHELWRDPLFWANLKPKQASQIEVNNARKEGIKVLFCTAPWEDCREWDQTRREWLKRHFGALGRDDTIITSAKEFIYADTFIDDKPDTVIKWNNRWKKYGLLFETPSNKYDPKAFNLYPRVSEVKEGWKFIKKEYKDE